jgi:hypothetical protein
MKFKASIPRLTILKKGLEKRKEIYCISVVRTEASEEKALGLREKIFSAVGSGSLKDVVPALGVRVSPVIGGVRSGQPIPLSGAGFIVTEEIDPGQFVEVYFAIVESDVDARAMTDALTTALSGQFVSGLIASVASTAAGSFLPLVAQHLPGVLKKIGADDPLYEHMHTGALSDNYGMEFHLGLKDDDSGVFMLPIRNENIEGVLAVMLSE